MTEAADAGVVRELLSPLSRFLRDKTLYEVIVNRPGQVVTEGRQGWQTYEMPELSFDRLMRLARSVASFSNQAIDQTRPILSATLPDDERIQIVIPPATTRGTVSITIRKPSSVSLTLEDLDHGGLFADVLRVDGDGSRSDQRLLEYYRIGAYKAFLREAVFARKNIIISGATGSGKTTLSKALIRHIPQSERIISIEDTPELVVPQPNHVRLFYSKGGQGLSKVDAKDLLESCLRMRPDRILLQELRDGTAFYYIRNVNSGHPGSITTVHADSARLAFEQLTLLVKESEGGGDLERHDIREMLTIAVDIIIQCKRIDGRFRVSEIYYRDATTDLGRSSSDRA
ncbi:MULTISPECIES: P-type DNA transfer ATPase VirB11 [Rhizobium]|uniref:Type IV secretion system protein VirB11 n=2 Tax=Rhizobium TaxID=379 RepID=A0A7W6QBL4_9HYPH|nr:MULTISPECIES: P-type DNA transfer ATPase VirB11 [Rhizobium]KEC69590.1 transport secretion system IV protein, VirB11 [Rhizobium leguminosarum bv. phaseoli CCGM1]ARO26824.1 type IV secretion system protein VirB11 [Rhizobium sp. TAL182]MBB4194544.1 type IV secretion system protein VirB11 [Rhizobium aethiopicum]MBB4582283.1 type IV secretion system protein VirB11 [Rhizobium aethiopicum]OWV83335.1 type IV secretion system protein VirB11 [Rhizobium sp. N122]